MLGRLGEIPVAVGEQCNFPLDKVPVEKQGESVQVYPVLTLCYWLWKGTDAASLVFITVCCVLMGAYVIWLHRSNIQRLKNGTEYRFGEKKKENQ